MMAGASIRARAPSATSANVNRIMRANYGDELIPERELRSLLHQSGLRFRKNCRPIAEFRCEADIVFPRRRVCVFVDGCFWHGCPYHFVCPKSNAQWWAEKVGATRVRDKRQRKYLRLNGWSVLQVWEHQVQNDIRRVEERILTALGIAERT